MCIDVLANIEQPNDCCQKNHVFFPVARLTRYWLDASTASKSILGSLTVTAVRLGPVAGDAARSSINFAGISLSVRQYVILRSEYKKQLFALRLEILFFSYRPRYIISQLILTAAQSARRHDFLLDTVYMYLPGVEELV